jgi:hypothetical protein
VEKNQGVTSVRVLYLDEAGIGNLKNDPILVVAGVLIHADTQWGNIARRLQSILDESTPKGAPVPKFLHAKDIFHGSGEYPRESWSNVARHGLLDKIAKIPAEFDVPIVWSAIDRREFAKEHPNDPPQDQVRDCYTVATLCCLMQTELYMRDLPNQGEVASVILEQNHELQRRLPEILEFIRNPDDGIGLLPQWKSVIPFAKIIDSPSSQPKTGSSILQLADFCSFAIKRFMQKSNGATRYSGPIASQLLMLREANLEQKSALWNPKFMPRVWGNSIVFENGRFIRKV